MAHTCRRCKKSNLGKCSLGYLKTDIQLSEEGFKCFSEVILKSYDTSETSDEILATKGPYGDAFRADEITRIISNLQKNRNESNLVRVGV